IAAQVEPLITGQPKIDLEYNKFCSNSFFGGFTTWNDVPDAIKIRMCEYLETVFPLLQVPYDNWASKIFFAKAFGRKGRNPARTLSIKKYQSMSNDSDYIQACHDDDASICEGISSNIDSEELSALYVEEGDPSLYLEVLDEVSEEYNIDNVPNSSKLQKNKCPPEGHICQGTCSLSMLFARHNLEIRMAKDTEDQRRIENKRKRRESQEVIDTMVQTYNLSESD
ncbi:hypothetical protein V1507DRAFT_469951, partial [Lipomyces tetrasporus]